MKDINRVKNGKLLYEQLFLKIEALETLATKTTQHMTGMPRGGSGTSEDVWALLADYRSECIGAVYQYLVDCKELDEEIDSLPYKRRAFQTRAAMKCRYLDGLTDEQIAEKLHYSDRYIRDLLFDGRKLYYEKYGGGDE